MGLPRLCPNIPGRYEHGNIVAKLITAQDSNFHFNSLFLLVGTKLEAEALTNILSSGP